MADALDDDFAASSYSGSGDDGSDGEIMHPTSPLASAGENEGDVYDNDSVGIGADEEKQTFSTRADGSADSKKRKRKDKDKARKHRKAQERAEASGAVTSIAESPIDLQLDYLQSKQRLAFPKLTSMELDEMRLEERMLRELGTSVVRTIDSLAGIIAQALPKLKDTLSAPLASSSVPPGSPIVMVVTGNAMRAADLARGLRPLLPSLPSTSRPRPSKKARGTADLSRSKGKNEKAAETFEQPLMVAKLFARHQKLREHADQLSKQHTPLASGTPQRIAALINNGALNLSHLQLLLVDTTWKDAKERTLFDGPETRNATFQLLAAQAVAGALRRDNPAKLALF